MELRYSVVGADWYCCLFLRLRRRKKASAIRAIRATPPATPPPTSAPRWLDEDAGRAVGEVVCSIALVAVLRPPPAAEVITETMEMMLTRFVGDGIAVSLPAVLVNDVNVNANVDVERGVVEVDDDDDVDVVSLDVVSALPGFPSMLAVAAAGPVVLIEATEVPLDNEKKSLELVLSQQTLDAFRLWSQHQSPP